MGTGSGSRTARASGDHLNREAGSWRHTAPGHPVLSTRRRLSHL